MQLKPWIGSLRFRLLLLGLFAVVPALWLIFYSANQQKRFAREQAEEGALRLARVAAAHHNRVVEDSRQILTALAQVPEVSQIKAPTCNQFFAHLLRQYPHYLNFGVIRPDGSIACSGLKISSSTNLSDRLYFRRAIEKKDFAIGEYQVGRISGKPSVNFGYPITDDKKDVKGVIFAALDLNWFNEFAATAELPPGAELTVIDHRGTILIRHPDSKHWIGRSIKELPGIGNILLGRKEGMAEGLGPDGIARLYGFSQLTSASDLGVLVSIGLPKSLVFEKVNTLFIHSLVGLVLVSFLALAAAWFGGEALIRRQVTGLVNATKRLAKGDLEARTGVTYGKGELNQLAQAFDQMAASLQGRELEAKKSQERLHHLAFFNPLTDLPNRPQFREKIQMLLSSAPVEKLRPFAVMVMDLERFMEINYTLGQPNSDKILQQIAPRLRRTLRENEMIAHISDNQFAVLLPDTDATQASVVANRIQKVLEEPFEIAGIIVEVGANIGIAMYPGHGDDVDVLLRHAEVALYQAKNIGSMYSFYLPESDPYNPMRLRLLGELRSAIAAGQLLLHCQPKVSLKTHNVVALEALVRWHHPIHKLISPGQFIPVIESTGLIKPLTEWVLDAALIQCHKWHQAGIRIPVAVNLSARNLIDSKIVDRIRDFRLTWGIAANWLDLEITESAILADPAGALKILQELSEMGHQLVIDDFGTGYSSLTYLQKLPVKAIKIDQSFVMSMPESNDAESIVRSIIELGHTLGLKVIAEGVETRQIWEKLLELKCDEAQGNFISQPFEVDELSEWLRTSQWQLAEVN
jgi:diguanylate cyclase (GGDEF)-like protein